MRSQAHATSMTSRSFVAVLVDAVCVGDEVALVAFVQVVFTASRIVSYVHQREHATTDH